MEHEYIRDKCPFWGWLSRQPLIWGCLGQFNACGATPEHYNNKDCIYEDCINFRLVKWALKHGWKGTTDPTN